MATPDRPLVPVRGRARVRRGLATAAVVTLTLAGAACGSDTTEDPTDGTLAPEPAGGDEPVEDPVTDDGSVDE